MEASTRFYAEVFGFKKCGLIASGRKLSDLVDIPGELAMKCQFLEKDGVLIELVKYENPGHLGTSTPHPANQLGLTHLSFRIKDMVEIENKIIQFGGTVKAKSRTVFDGTPSGITGVFLFSTDPDGIRIELMQIPDVLQFR